MDGLTLRMTLVLVTAALAIAALIAAMAYAMAYGAWLMPAALLVVVALGAFAGNRVVRRERFHPVSADVLRVQGALDRLALAADVAAPEGVVERDGEPLSWTTALPEGVRRSTSPRGCSTSWTVRSWKRSSRTSWRTSSTATRSS